MAAAADDEDWGSASFGMSAAAPAPAPAPAADDGDDEFSVSFGMDPAVGTSVEHTEGTSYLVAFGHPTRYPLPLQHFEGVSRLNLSYPAAGGENPYQPERGRLAHYVAELVPVDVSAAPPSALVTVLHIASALCVTIYDALRRVPEQSRGLSTVALMGALMDSNSESNEIVKIAFSWMVRHDASPNGGGSLFACLLVCLYRMCRCNGTLQAFATTPDLATISAPGEFDLQTLYFNLSARERKRLREYAKSVRRERRMPSILARQLIIRKVDKRKLHGQLRRLVYGLFMTESDELFRVVVSFL